ncbi:replication endonuclease [Aggregatibacter actinomycetemcomitans]|uniref:replication endonuclease n=1 Tax=Aggregatibacter actinomycetemcomitans TaxID=714 RepID=UPI0021CC9AD3|nr:replication endonuclease [Aggregatibacter actinomycetemcomitans]
MALIIKKWQGADPRQTHAYLNKVLQQLCTLFAKRDIGFFGMRGVEPHHDATPHWHLLLYIDARHKDEVIRLFKAKALELDGDEFGAKKHRCRVDEIDKEKGSAVSYIAKYIAKNIYAGKQKDEDSDEVEGLKLDENVQRCGLGRTFGAFANFSSMVIRRFPCGVSYAR